MAPNDVKCIHRSVMVYGLVILFNEIGLLKSRGQAFMMLRGIHVKPSFLTLHCLN